ncbi:MAG TPA: efflux RND transporter periplasmic adaptor subunit [Woeseiaceae bacterium]|nr:efflux RND transporter periplasmic adaptor subunit [Woeseiaceae bacterium]|tara:strand:+ start:4985 stop:6532 length:1548 start_codon:yes stop_codon:yes gene_type:complete
MKKTITLSAALVAVLVIGISLGRWWPVAGEGTAASASGEREVLYYKAPMDPNYRADKPGKSPMGMDLVPVYADEVAGDDPSVVKISPTVVNNLGVRSAAVESGVLSRRIETVGYVGYDEDSLHQINTRVDGWIEKLSIKSTGDPVKRGQVLFELYSPTLVNAQEEYLAALKSSNTALHQASRERLAALGVTASEIRRLDKERTAKQRIRIYAQTDGVVAHLGVREGVYITPSTEVLSIANLDEVWVMAEVFERQSAWVRHGQRAEIELDYLPGQRWQGTVDYVYPELDQKTRTLKVRVRFDNEADVLRPNMFARVTIFGTETPAVVHIPKEALIPGGAVNRVVVALEEGKFRAQPVEIGIESGDRIEILSGLTAADRVVTSGQFLIDSESNIDTALARMDEGMADDTPMIAMTSVMVAAVVTDIDTAAQKVTLQHEAIPEWEWPAMTMSFDVAKMDLFESIDAGQSVHATIEKHGDDHYLVVDIQAAMDTDAEREASPLDEAPASHEGHTMEPEQ